MQIGPSVTECPALAPRSSGSSPKLADESGHFLPSEDSEAGVDISERAQQILERERRNIDKARESQAFVDFQGHDGKIRLGLMALGETAINGWSDKGLELTEDTILSAAETFQTAFKKSLEENGSDIAGAAIALNRHQIVINSQEVPDWFIKEYESTLSSMAGGSVKSAFDSGNTFFLSPPSASTIEALSRYTSWDR